MQILNKKGNCHIQSHLQWRQLELQVEHPPPMMTTLPPPPFPPPLPPQFPSTNLNHHHKQLQTSKQMNVAPNDAIIVWALGKFCFVHFLFLLTN